MRLRPGDTYADWEILECIGTGSFGNAFRVRSKLAPEDGVFALKLSHEPLEDQQTAQRALREVVVQRECDNPHTPTIHEYGLQPDGHFYLLMDFLSGKPLSSVHDFARPMEPSLALEIIRQICTALGPLHDRGIVHRDVKPANIFWDAATSHASLLDFGLARSWEDDEMHGMTATLGPFLVGTPHYAQPEQLNEQQLTPAADVYSLAMIAYELLSARVPFVADRPFLEVRAEWEARPIRWVDAHVRMKVVPLEKHLGRGVLSRGQFKSIARALSKDPAKRPATAIDFREALG